MGKTVLKEKKSRQIDYRIGVALPIATIEAIGGADKKLRDSNYSKILEAVLSSFVPPNPVAGVKFMRVQVSRRYGAVEMIFFNVDESLHTRKSEAIKSIQMRGAAAYFNELVFIAIIEKFGA